MGPPREHGGMTRASPPAVISGVTLQWGRRVNTAEWLQRAILRVIEGKASMGPPREHGGMVQPAERPGNVVVLQWGRRVNTAECPSVQRLMLAGGALQWGRRVNTAEWTGAVTGESNSLKLQWGRRVNTAECSRSSVA